ncbi:unnamed protein product [Urochloa humidicola]
MNPSNNSHGANADPGSNYNGANGNVYNNNDGGSCGYSDYSGNNDHYQTHVCDGGEHCPHGHAHYNNGDRQGYRQGQPMMEEHLPKVKASCDAGIEAEEKPEANVVSVNGKEQKEASAPASESDKSATGGAAQDGPNNGQGARAGTKYPFQKGKVNGSEKRKKKNAKKNSGTETEKVKKQDSEVDNSKKQADKQPLEEEKKTLAEYERTRDEKKKSSEASKTEVREVTAEAFEGLQMLERKKLDDGKPKKVIVPRQNLGFKAFKPTRRVTLLTYDQEGYSGHRDAMGNGGYGYGRGNGGYGYGRGNGGYQSNGGNYSQRRPGNDRYYQQRGNSGDHRNSAPAPAPDMKLDMSLFPALPAPASALSSAPAQASSPAAAPAQA